MSYKDLEIWQLARDLVIDIHAMTMEKLPKHEVYEEGSQIRRSIKTVRSAITEGYGRREHVQDYLRYLTIAISSNDETIDHLETLFETKSLKDQELYGSLNVRLEALGKKLNKFMGAIRQRLTKPSGSLLRSQSPEPRAQETSNG